MTNPDKKAPVDRLTDAYEEMLEHVHDAMQETKNNALPGLREYLSDVREKMVEIGELTREEAEQLATYLERDIKDAATYLHETGEQLSEWWRFDVQQVEDRLLEMFIKVADQTILELDRLAEKAQQASTYHTGEITGPGTLICRNCGKAMNFKKAGHIPPCPECKGTEFVRFMDKSEDEN
ncbi:MAG: zinc ribbon-containing protein [Chromatiales bacterium]|jgi:Zn finger protein HypA/HybF involved in hydrogenase expression